MYEELVIAHAREGKRLYAVAVNRIMAPDHRQACHYRRAVSFEEIRDYVSKTTA